MNEQDQTTHKRQVWDIFDFVQQFRAISFLYGDDSRIRPMNRNMSLGLSWPEELSGWGPRRFVQECVRFGARLRRLFPVYSLFPDFRLT